MVVNCDGMRQRARDRVRGAGSRKKAATNRRAGRLWPMGEQEEGTGQDKDILESKTGHTQTFLSFFLLYLTITLATGIQYWP